MFIDNILNVSINMSTDFFKLHLSSFLGVHY